MNIPTNRKKTLHLVGLVVLVAVVVPFVVFAVPQVTGAEHSYVVLSSSMSPAYEAGDAVIVNDVPPEKIEEGDVITFQASSGMDEQTQGTDRITHRVVEVVEKDGELYFRTKGDANEEPDNQLVPGSNLVGRVQFGIPSIGYVTTFANGTMMQFGLIVVPAVLLVLNEIWTLARAARAASDDATEPSSGGE